MSRIKAVLSDGGNILFSDNRIKQEQYNLISQHIPELSYAQFRNDFQKYKILSQTLPNYNSGDALKDYLTSIGRHDLCYIAFQSRNKKQEPLQLIEGVYETLKSLYRASFPYIILTDSTKTGAELKPFLVNLGIDKFITDVISSKDIGVIKPDPLFFNAALEKYSLNKDEVIFIAHDTDEVFGAYKFGLRVYAFNFDDSQDLSWLSKEQKIKEFRELEKIITEK